MKVDSVHPPHTKQLTVGRPRGIKYAFSLDLSKVDFGARFGVEDI